MKAFRGNKLLLLSIPLFAAMVIIVSFLARESRPDPAAGSGSRAGSTSKTPDPGSAMEDLRRMRQRSPGAAQENSAELRAARQSLVELEEAAIPRIQNGIRSSSESELFRFELISVLADMKSPRAESALVEVFTGGSLEEKYRALALVKLTGRSSDEIFRAFQEVLERERNFGGRHLVVKALGLIKREEVTTILIGSAERDPSPSARIQAVESLGTRLQDLRVIGALRSLAIAPGDGNVRVAALGSYARFTDPSVDETLKKLSENPDELPAVRETARNCLLRRAGK